MRFLLAFTLLFLFAQRSDAQRFILKGTVKDTLNAAPLPLASAVLIRAADSVIETFSRADGYGAFELHTPKAGKYIVRIAFPNFADYTETVNITKELTDLGEVPMITKEHLLQEFVLKKQIAAIKIKGDTTEYMADSFGVKENANVEDLLKKLPGIQVDKNGKISAQGETVAKILVDGEEFFSDDPKVITRGLQANAVEKVQVFDKKSDQAEFTGIDDGEKTRTINLQLKENKKKGYFGKLDVGGGTEGYFQNQGMISAFKGKRQLSAFGITSNTDKVGLGWNDNGKFGDGGISMDVGQDGDVNYTYDGEGDDFGGWNGNYDGEGLPKIWTGGGHYAEKWNEDKQNVAANYRYAKQNVEMNGVTTTQFILTGDSSNINEQRKSQFNQATRQAADGKYEWKIDSSSTLKLTVGGSTKQSQTASIYNTNVAQLTQGERRMLYNNIRNVSSTGNSSFANASLLYRKRFAKKGRSMSVDVRPNYNENESDGQLISSIIYSTPTGKDSVINQDKVNNNRSVSLTSKVSYTEPLSKVMFLEVNYSIKVNNSNGSNLSYNNRPGYDRLFDSTFSSNYQYDILTNTGGANLRFVYKKLNFSFGGDISNASYLQTDLLHGDTSHRYTFLNFFPRANFKYKVSNQSSVSFSYQGNTQQPSISQVQPLRQNTDPTNVTVGNPSLTQEFRHRLSSSWNDYKVLTGRWIWMNGSFSIVDNAISTARTNREGINTTQYVNVNGNYNGYLWAGIGFKVKKTNFSTGIHINPSISRNNNFINNIKNTSNNNVYKGGLEFKYDKEEKYSFSFEPDISYNDNKSSLNTFMNNYWQSDNTFSATVTLPKKIEIGTSADFLFRQQTAVFTTNNNVIKWNAYISKKLLKKSELEIRASVFDILNQNLGYQRNAQGSIITENSYNTIRRYGLLSLVWNFTHTPGAASAEGEAK